MSASQRARKRQTIDRSGIKIHCVDPVKNRFAALPPGKHGKHIHAVEEAPTVAELVEKLKGRGLDPSRDVSFMFIPEPGVRYIF